MKTIWEIDPAHSEIRFKVKHFMVSYVTGHFRKFSATVETEGEDIATAKVRFTADARSISTNNEQRDQHLQSKDFFDAERYPEVIFESERIDVKKENSYRMYGRLTLRGVTKPIVLDVEFGGIMNDDSGNTRAGFSVSGQINRRDFGISFSMISETGGILLSDEVSIQADAEFIKQKELQPA
ncbi:MAG: YceI family protein [Bacteroidota bacterium]